MEMEVHPVSAPEITTTAPFQTNGRRHHSFSCDFHTAEPRGCLGMSLCSIIGSLNQLNMGGQKEKQIFLTSFKCRECHFCVSLEGSVVEKEM